MSAAHCKIEDTGAKLVLTDMTSRNGTYVKIRQRERARPRRLRLHRPQALARRGHGTELVDPRSQPSCPIASRAKPRRTCFSTRTTPSIGTRGGREALESARDTTSRSFSRIGYSACHWCHVMERESFENEASRADERACSSTSRSIAKSGPTSITSISSSSSSWGAAAAGPSPCFSRRTSGRSSGDVLPAGRPVRHARLSQGARGVAEAYRDQRGEIARRAAPARSRRPSRAPPTRRGARRAVSAELSIDQRRDQARVRASTTSTAASDTAPSSRARWRSTCCFARATLRAFARRSEPCAPGGSGTISAAAFTATRPTSVARAALREDALRQRAPPAALRRRLARAARASLRADGARDRGLRRARDDVAGGRFYATQDADSEGEEGKFFVWTPAEVDAACGDDVRPPAWPRSPST
jgi:hypothetical protein